MLVPLKQCWKEHGGSVGAVGVDVRKQIVHMYLFIHVLPTACQRNEEYYYYYDYDYYYFTTSSTTIASMHQYDLKVTQISSSTT